MKKVKPKSLLKTIATAAGLEIPRRVTITRETVAAYDALVKEIAYGPRSYFGESGKSRGETLEILRAAGREPSDLAADVAHCRSARRR